MLVFQPEDFEDGLQYVFCLFEGWFNRDDRCEMTQVFIFNFKKLLQNILSIPSEQGLGRLEFHFCLLVFVVQNI